jgi:glycerophosphoryl diester phosphodiesterase
MVVAACATEPRAAPVPLPSTNPFRVGRTLMIPHAGGDGLFPENTLYAYEHSMALGGDVVDIDVSMSDDNVLIAFHDPTLERTTNGTGRVADKTYAELSVLDAGWSYGNGDHHPFRGKGISIPTVEAVLHRFPTTLVTLDLKDQRTNLVQPVCALLRNLGRTSDVYVGSDSNDQVLSFREQCPEVHTSGTDTERRAMRAARQSGDTTFVTHQLVGQPGFRADDGSKRITPEYLAYSHSKGIAVLTWVVDDPKEMEDLIVMGVDGIYTRRPDVMKRVIDELNRATG